MGVVTRINNKIIQVKILQAIVTQKPIVSFGFVEALANTMRSNQVVSGFANDNRAVQVPSPCDSEYVPNNEFVLFIYLWLLYRFRPAASTSISFVEDIFKSRERLLIDHTVILLEKVSST